MEKVFIGINGLGLDAKIFDNTQIKTLSKNKVNRHSLEIKGITMPGFFDNEDDVIDGINDHYIHLNTIINEYKRTNKEISLWGFSYGADLLAYLLNIQSSKLSDSIKNVFINDLNINQRTTVISKYISTCNEQDKHLVLSHLLTSLADEIADNPLEMDFLLHQTLSYWTNIKEKRFENIAKIAKFMVDNSENFKVNLLDAALKMKNTNFYVRFSNKEYEQEFIKAMKIFNVDFDNVKIESIVKKGHFVFITESFILKDIEKI